MTLSSRDLPDLKENKQQSPKEHFIHIIKQIGYLINVIDENVDEDEEKAQENKNTLLHHFVTLCELKQKIKSENINDIYKSILISILSPDSNSYNDLYCISYLQTTFHSVIGDIRKSQIINHTIKQGILTFEEFLESCFTILISNNDSDSEVETSDEEEKEKKVLSQEESPLTEELKLEKSIEPELIKDFSEKLQHLPASAEKKLSKPQREIKEKPFSSLVIDYEADLDQYPKKNDDEKLTPDKVLTVGDMHGNALKFIYILIRHQVLDINKSDYEQLIMIYNTPVPKINEKKSYPDHAFEERVKIYAENIKLFNTIINNAFERMDPKKIGQLRLLGDLISDRGQNDYFTLRIIECFAKKEPSIIKEILLSNHDYNAFVEIYNLNNPHKPTEPWFLEKHAFFKQSLLNLIELIKLKLVSLQWVTKTLNTHFKPLLKLISYARETSHDGNKYLSFYTHAPTKFMYALQNTMHCFELKEDPSRSKLSNLIYIIDNINQILNQSQEMLEPKFRLAITHIIDDRLSELTFIDKKEEKQAFPKKISSYLTQFRSGHDFSKKHSDIAVKSEPLDHEDLRYFDIAVESDSFEKILQFTENLDHTCSFDNFFGRMTLKPKGIYFSKITSEPHLLRLMLYIETALEDVQKALKNPDMNEFFGDAFMLYEKDHDHNQFKENWADATEYAILTLKKSEAHSPLISNSVYSVPSNPSFIIIEMLQEINEKISCLMTTLITESSKLELTELKPPASLSSEDSISAHSSLSAHS